MRFNSKSEIYEGKTFSTQFRKCLLGLSAIVVIFGISYSLFVSHGSLSPQARTVQIESEVKCPSCEGVSALDSETSAAHAVRSFVSESVAQGKSNSEIFVALENSYGPSILMTPPTSNGGTWIAVLPFIFVALVVGLLGFLGYKRRALIMSDQRELAVAPADDLGEELGAALQAQMLAYAGSDVTLEPEIYLEPLFSDADTITRVGSKGLKQFMGSKKALYLGIIFVFLGAGSGASILRNENQTSRQALSVYAQAKFESQTILEARTLANSGQDVQALKLLSSVLVIDPNQPIALTYQGWLLRQAGEKDKSPVLINQGQQFLEKAVNLDPSYPDARVFLGYVLLQDRHNASGAVTQFKAFLADKPTRSSLIISKPIIIQAFHQVGLAIPPQLSG